MSIDNVSVILAETHPIMRVGMRRLLEQHKIVVVAEASTGEDAYHLYRLHRPTLLMLDLHIPRRGGLDTAHRIRAFDTKANILTLSASDNDALFCRAMGVGVRGYLNKRAQPTEIISAARRVAAGEDYYDRTLTARCHSKGGSAQATLSSLTRREFDVFLLLAGGFSAKEIATTLSISAKTVGVHQTRIMKKLNVRAHTHLARLAIQHGLLTV